MVIANVSSSNLSQRIVEELRDGIQRGELVPGERLVERKLAEALGVSHIPVREALAKLAKEGLVERTPRRCARVAELTPEELAEISSLRTVLEQFVAVRAQERWTPKAERSLRSLVDLMVAAATIEDLDQLFALDRRFHEALWKLADHTLLLTVSSQLRGRINGFLRAANSTLGNDELVAHASAHSQIVDALASKGQSAARTEMARHIEIAAERIVSVQSSTPS